MKDSPGYQSIIFSFCFPFSVAGSDASAQEQSTPSLKGSEDVSSTTEPATTTQPQSTTAEIPTTKGPDMECGVVIVGGGKIAYCCYHCKIYQGSLIDFGFKTKMQGGIIIEIHLCIEQGKEHVSGR